MKIHYFRFIKISAGRWPIQHINDANYTWLMIAVWRNIYVSTVDDAISRGIVPLSLETLFSHHHDGNFLWKIDFTPNFSNGNPYLLNRLLLQTNARWHHTFSYRSPLSWVISTRNRNFEFCYWNAVMVYGTVIMSNDKNKCWTCKRNPPSQYYIFVRFTFVVYTERVSIV